MNTQKDKGDDDCINITDVVVYMIYATSNKPYNYKGIRLPV